MVRFFIKGDIYGITRMTGNQDNILGIFFAEKNTSEYNKDNIQLIAWDSSNSEKIPIRMAENEVLTQVFLGLNSFNEALGTDYQITKIYYVTSGYGSGNIYRGLTLRVLERYHSGIEYTGNKE